MPHPPQHQRRGKLFSARGARGSVHPAGRGSHGDIGVPRAVGSDVGHVPSIVTKIGQHLGVVLYVELQRGLAHHHIQRDRLSRIEAAHPPLAIRAGQACLDAGLLEGSEGHQFGLSPGETFDRVQVGEPGRLRTETELGLDELNGTLAWCSSVGKSVNRN